MMQWLVSGPPKIDIDIVSKYLKDLQRVLKAGQPENLKKLVRLCVQKIRMAPDDREVRFPSHARAVGTAPLRPVAGFEPGGQGQSNADKAEGED